ncbi:MAG: universal stress protein UspA [Spirochaetes bacterium GWF1_41_5]|nr:MAG: universal stress protein UspA [Spirochaetes bacterium GWF1_41_5]HBE04686.1 universal stress protein [Spirochaetia bacterium]
MNPLIKRILVYIDGTEAGSTASLGAVILARSIQAELHALYVINTRALSDLVKTHIFLQSEEEEYHRDLEADADRYLNFIKNTGLQKGLQVITHKKSGTVHAEIKNIIAEIRADLLVIGELSHIQSRRDQFYDEQERAMRIVNCPVLIIKDDDRIRDLYEQLV